MPQLGTNLPTIVLVGTILLVLTTAVFAQPAFYGRPAAPDVEAILKDGGDVNARFESGITPLHYAALKGNAGAIRELLDAGADVNARTTAEYEYVSGILGGQWANKPELVLPADSTPLDAARLMHEQKKWNTYAWYPSVELLKERGGTERFRIGLGGWVAIGCGGSLALLIAMAWGTIILVRMMLQK